jgi:hypothetical protein
MLTGREKAPQKGLPLLTDTCTQALLTALCAALGAGTA